MAKVTFAGIDLMEDDEGNFSFAPGVFAKKGREFEQMGRASGLLMREMASTGCEHVVTMRFRGMDPSTVENRIRNAYEAGLGTLTVDGYGSYGDCAMREPGRIGEGRYSANIEGTRTGIGMPVQLVFVQTAE